MELADSRGQERTDGREPVVVGLVAAGGMPHELAERLADELPGLLRERYPEVGWKVVVRVEPLAGTAGRSADLVQVTRRRMLEEGWQLAVCLTDLPLHLGRRPVTAYASAALGVGVVSVPALGAVTVESRLRGAVLRLVRGLLGDDLTERGGDRRRHGVVRRLRELASPVGAVDVEDSQTVRFVTATWRGNLRLFLGMVRANRPWRLVVGLSRVLVAALGTAAFGLSSAAIWLIADGMGSLRQILVALASILVTCVLLIAFQGLWEQGPRDPDREARERVVLINLATATTVALGIITLYLALFVINLVASWALIAPSVLVGQVRHGVGAGDYVELALLVTSLATVASALGAALESAETVREAAYGYRSDDSPDTGDGQ